MHPLVESKVHTFLLMPRLMASCSYDVYTSRFLFHSIALAVPIVCDICARQRNIVIKVYPTVAWMDANMRYCCWNKRWKVRSCCRCSITERFSFGSHPYPIPFHSCKCSIVWHCHCILCAYIVLNRIVQTLCMFPYYSYEEISSEKNFLLFIQFKLKQNESRNFVYFGSFALNFWIARIHDDVTSCGNISQLILRNETFRLFIALHTKWELRMCMLGGRQCLRQSWYCAVAAVWMTSKKL